MRKVNKENKYNIIYKKKLRDLELPYLVNRIL